MDLPELLPTQSLAQYVASLPSHQQEAIIRSISHDHQAGLMHAWDFWARPSQMIPGTGRALEQRRNWLYWIALAGRGWGKTRVGAETVRKWAENPRERILMIAPTASDVREVMIEGLRG